MSILKPNWNHKDIYSRTMQFFESKYYLRLDSNKDGNVANRFKNNMQIDGANLRYLDSAAACEILDTYFKKIKHFGYVGYVLDYECLTRTAIYVEDLVDVAVTVDHGRDSISRGSNVDSEETPYLVRVETWFIPEVETFVVVNLKPDNEGIYPYWIFTQYRTSPIVLLNHLTSGGFLTLPEPIAPRPRIGLLVDTGHGLDVTSTSVHVPNIVDINIPYGTGFSEVSDNVLDIIKSKDRTGLMIFHGPAGTGKTSYIKWLSGQTHRRFIYIPSYMVRAITEPTFMSLFLTLKDTVFIIEDAEESLGPRHSGGNSIVSTLLNLTDGILANALNCQFICTFNTEIKNIDPALLRPGRLLVRHEFKALNVEDATTYLTHNGYDGEIPDEPKTLAQLSNINKTIIDNTDVTKSTNPIGFGFNSF